MISLCDIYMSYIWEVRMTRMTRTIISIPVDEKKWLDGFGKRHRVSSAEVVRRALKEYRQLKADRSLTGVLQETAGTWTSIEGDSQEYIDTMRAEWDQAAWADTGGKSVRESRVVYGSPGPSMITDAKELRQRAIEAAGRFESGVPDLSVGHDRYLADEQAVDGADKDLGASDLSKKAGGSR